LAEYRQSNCLRWLNPLLLTSVINGGITVKGILKDADARL